MFTCVGATFTFMHTWFMLLTIVMHKGKLRVSHKITGLAFNWFSMMSVKCFNPFLSGSVRFSPFLSVSLRFCPFMSVYVPFCLFLSVSLCFCPFLSVWGFVVSFCATIRTCREIQCLLYAGFLLDCCGFRIQMRLVNCPFCV